MVTANNSTGDHWELPTPESVEPLYLHEPDGSARLQEAFLAASNEERVAFFRWLSEQAEQQPAR